MIYTAPQEFFFTEVKLALFGAIFIAFPVIASQIYMFVAPGLYRNERQAFLPYLIATMLVRGRAGLAEFSDAAVRDADVLLERAASKLLAGWGEAKQRLPDA